MYITAQGGGREWSGTGFAYAVSTERDGSLLALVSNKHVLLGAEHMRVQFLKSRADRTPALGEAVSVTVDEPGASIEQHPDPAVDVAVMPLGGILDALDERGEPAFIRAIPSDIAVTASAERELDAIESVLFLGYPNGIFDTANFTPVARRGTTAAPIALDYRGEPAFLVDAAVYPGSSGSPVLIFDAGSYTPRGGWLTIGSRIILLGIIAAVHTTQVGGRVVSLPAQQAVEVDTPIGLGIVYKVRTIEYLIDRVLSRQGVKRAAAPGS